MNVLTTAQQGTEWVEFQTTARVWGFKQVKNSQGFNCCFLG
jgi:hypothetical protein